MQILNAGQVRAWDEHTILNEPISSVDLMERAAGVCYQWLMENGYEGKKFTIICGKGNNGGDGLAIARMLRESEHSVTVYILEFGHKGTEDFQFNLARLHETKADIRFISTPETISPIPAGEIVIDALYGSGLNRPLDGLSAMLVEHINNSGNEIIAIDIPSGLFVDKSSRGNIVIKAHHTLSFQCYKLSFLVAENESFLGDVHILDIGLHPGYLRESCSPFVLVDKPVAKKILRPRNKFSHKGNYGHAALVTGSFGLMGASTLCARACLRSGVGKLTCHIPACGYIIIQVAVPEAMSKVEAGTDWLEDISSLEKYDSVGIGPGIGLYPSHNSLLKKCLELRRPMVIDADALNVLSQQGGLLHALPENSILTPHKREWERLFGESANDFDTLQRTIQKAADLQIIIVLKGHHTVIATPGGKVYFNNSGNAGMATAGSGDVLTGLITGLQSQGYNSEEAAVLGVYVHGLAGDLAASFGSQESLIASDIIDNLGGAFRELY